MRNTGNIGYMGVSNQRIGVALQSLGHSKVSMRANKDTKKSEKRRVLK